MSLEHRRRNSRIRILRTVSWPGCPGSCQIFLKLIFSLLELASNLSAALRIQTATAKQVRKLNSVNFFIEKKKTVRQCRLRRPSKHFETILFYKKNFTQNKLALSHSNFDQFDRFEREALRFGQIIDVQQWSKTELQKLFLYQNYILVERS